MPAKLKKEDYPKIGEKFQEWIVIDNEPYFDKYHKTRFKVMCSCGNSIKLEYLHQLKLGSSKMCKHCACTKKGRGKKLPKMLTKNISFIIDEEKYTPERSKRYTL